jgi:hypothetical protein
MRTFARTIILATLPLLALFAGCATQPKPQPPMPVAAVAMPTSDTPPGTAKPLVVVDGDKQYKVDRDRPFKAGESYDVHIQNNFDMTITIKGLTTAKKPGMDDISRKYDIAGRVLIKSLDAKGKPSAFTFTVEKCLSGKDALIPAGTVIDAKSTPSGMAYTLPDGKKASREITQALLGVFAIDNTSGNEPAVVDEVDAPRHVGDSWPLKLPPAAQRPIGDGARVQVTDIHLTSTLKSLAPWSGIFAAELENLFTGTLKFEKLPFGFTAQPAPLEARQTTRFPVDSALPPLEIVRDLNANITLEGTILFIPLTANVKVVMHQELHPVIADAARQTAAK